MRLIIPPDPFFYYDLLSIIHWLLLLHTNHLYIIAWNRKLLIHNIDAKYLIALMQTVKFYYLLQSRGLGESFRHYLSAQVALFELLLSSCQAFAGADHIQN